MNDKNINAELVSNLDLPTFKTMMKKSIWCDLVKKKLCENNIDSSRVNEEKLLQIIAKRSPQDTIPDILQYLLMHSDEFLEEQN